MERRKTDKPINWQKKERKKENIEKADGELNRKEGDKLNQGISKRKKERKKERNAKREFSKERRKKKRKDSKNEGRNDQEPL